VTIDQATYRMWAADGGIKWNGLAVNGQYFWRRLSDFDADGPLPLASTFDRGGELSAGYFVDPKKVMLYGRGSWVRGEFSDSHEYGGGVKWYFSRPSGLAQRRAVPGQQSSLQRGLYSVYCRHDGLGADGTDGPGFLTIISFWLRLSGSSQTRAGSGGGNALVSHLAESRCPSGH
jgi:hypothetical protein